MGHTQSGSMYYFVTNSLQFTRCNLHNGCYVHKPFCAINLKCMSSLNRILFSTKKKIDLLIRRHTKLATFFVKYSWNCAQTLWRPQNVLKRFFFLMIISTKIRSWVFCWWVITVVFFRHCDMCPNTCTLVWLTKSDEIHTRKINSTTECYVKHLKSIQFD